MAMGTVWAAGTWASTSWADGVWGDAGEGPDPGPGYTEYAHDFHMARRMRKWRSWMSKAGPFTSLLLWWAN